MSSGLKVHMLILVHNDLEAGIKFYQNLGLKLKFHVKDQWAEFDLDGIKLGIAHTQATELPERHTGIVLEVDNVAQWYEKLSKLGVVFVKEPVEAAHGIFASFKDSANNIIDIYQPTPEKLQELLKKQTEEQGCCSPENGCSTAKKDTCC